jgi:phage tail-like protein
MSADENTLPLYIAFNFEVILNLDDPPGSVQTPVCSASFSDCDGLEMTMEPRVVREGGNNQEHIRLMGPTGYGQLTLKRGMTKTSDLWQWFVAAGQTGRTPTAQGEVHMIDASGQARVIFTLRNCLPVKMRGPALVAKTGEIAIEEMQLVYSHLSVKHLDVSNPGDSGIVGGSGGGLRVRDSIGANVSVSAKLSIG